SSLPIQDDGGVVTSGAREANIKKCLRREIGTRERSVTTSSGTNTAANSPTAMSSQSRGFVNFTFGLFQNTTFSCTHMLRMPPLLSVLGALGVAEIRKLPG